MDDLEFIRSFMKIRVSNICKRCKIDVSNVLKGKASKELITRVRKEIESEYAKLHIVKEDKNVKGNS